MSTATLTHADCLDALRALPDNSVDSIVTDPPYGLAALPAAAVIETLTAWASGDREFMPSGKGFMGKSWDGFVPPPAVWDEALRVLKPGGHLLAFAGSRTQDLMGISIRMAGFEIRDSIAWLYGTGWPKSLDVSKGIDKAAGAEREVTGPNPSRRPNGDGVAGSAFNARADAPLSAPATDDARTWDGWGTALKPAHEPIIMARKPLAGTVVANVLAHGTGALNIGANRIDLNGESWAGYEANAHGNYSGEIFGKLRKQYAKPSNPAGRWPANVILDEGQAAELDAQSGITKSSANTKSDERTQLTSTSYGVGVGRRDPSNSHGDSGGASRFFYVAKAPKAERPDVDGVRHPTVKPLTLMRHLVRLVTPAGGTVLEPFAGSGATVEAALLEGFNCLAIEREADYIPLIEARIERVQPAALAA